MDSWVQNLSESSELSCFLKFPEIGDCENLWEFTGLNTWHSARHRSTSKKQANPQRKLHGKRNHERSTRDGFSPQLNVWVNWLVFQEKCMIAIIPSFLSKKEIFQCDPKLTSRQNRVNELTMTLVILAKTLRLPLGKTKAAPPDVQLQVIRTRSFCFLTFLSSAQAATATADP